MIHDGTVAPMRRFIDNDIFPSQQGAHSLRDVHIERLIVLQGTFNDDVGAFLNTEMDWLEGVNQDAAIRLREISENAFANDMDPKNEMIDESVQVVGERHIPLSGNGLRAHFIGGTSLLRYVGSDEVGYSWLETFPTDQLAGIDPLLYTRAQLTAQSTLAMREVPGHVAKSIQDCRIPATRSGMGSMLFALRREDPQIVLSPVPAAASNS